MKRIVFALLILGLFTGCSQTDTEVAEDIPYVAESEGVKGGGRSYIPLNYTKQTGIWFPYMRFEELLSGRSEDEYRRGIVTFLEES